MGQFVILALAMALSAGILVRTMLPERHASTGALFKRPPRRLLLVGFVALCALISEGAAGDWSGVFIKDSLGGTAQDAALAITFLSAAMAAHDKGHRVEVFERERGPGGQLRSASKPPTGEASAWGVKVASAR